MGFIVEHSGHMDTHVERELIKLKLKRKEGALNPRSIRRIIGSLSVAHDTRGIANPCINAQVRLVLKKLTIANSVENSVKQAITQDVLDLMLETCQDNLRGHHDRALLSLGFSSGGRRRSELAAITYNDLEAIDDGYILNIKNSQGQEDRQPMVGR